MTQNDLFHLHKLIDKERLKADTLLAKGRINVYQHNNLINRLQLEAFELEERMEKASGSNKSATA